MRLIAPVFALLPFAPFALVACSQPAPPPASNVVVVHAVDAAPSSPAAHGGEEEGAKWIGKYAAEWTAAPSQPSGVAPGVQYVIGVSRVPGGLGIGIQADGTQTLMRMRAYGRTTSAGDLEVRFASCEPDDMWQCKGYVAGDRLFTLHRAKDGTRLVFDKLGAPDGKTRSLHVKAG
jgi:hypothetical protein